MEQRKFNGDRLRNARIYNGISLTDRNAGGYKKAVYIII